MKRPTRSDKSNVIGHAQQITGNYRMRVSFVADGKGEAHPPPGSTGVHDSMCITAISVLPRRSTILSFTNYNQRTIWKTRATSVDNTEAETVWEPSGT